jgi:long-chain acyl-CoA synthetase
MKELVFSRLFLPAVERYAGQECVIDGAYTATFEQHAGRVLRLAGALRGELGLAAGDRFAVLSLNGHQFMELHNAGYLGAGVLNPLNFRLSPAELARIVEDSGARVLFADPRLGELSVPGLRTITLDGEYEDLLASGTEAVPPEPEESDLACLVYTGGTTGSPRGVMRSQRAEMLYVYHTSMSGGVASRSGWTFLHQSPMFHAAAMVSLATAPVFGVRSVVLPRFDPGACLDAVSTYSVTETVLVATMFQMLFDHPDFAASQLASLRSVGYGAMPMPPSLLDRIRRFLPDVRLAQGFGMTEAGVLTMLQPEDHSRAELLTSVGRAVPGVVLSIRSEDGAALAPGEVGEVWAQGGNLLDGYWKDPAGTDEALRDGWYHTGDAGYLDAEGYLFLADRLKDMIVTGGENVYSVEVEAVIIRHPAVAQVAIIAIPDEKWGEIVHAVVVPEAGVELSGADIIEFCRGKLAGYKIPKSVEIRTDTLPMSAAMKPLKRELRAEHRVRLGFSEGAG